MTEFAADQDQLLREETFEIPDADTWPDDEIIDQVLRLVANQHQSLGALIGRTTFSPTIAELRQSLLGRDLRLLAAATPELADAAATRAAARRVREVVLRPLATDEYETPAWFNATGLGQLLARAERAAYGPRGVVSVATAARQLGVTAGVINDWVASGMLSAVTNEQGQPQIPREVIAHRREIAALLASGEHEERLAS